MNSKQYIIRFNNPLDAKRKINFLLKKGFVLTSGRFKTLKDYEIASNIKDGRYEYDYQYYFMNEYDKYDYSTAIFSGGYDDCSRTLLIGRFAPYMKYEHGFETIPFKNFVKSILPKLLYE